MTVCDRCKAEIVSFEGYTLLLMKREHSWIPPIDKSVHKNTVELCNNCAVMIDNFAHSMNCRLTVKELAQP